MATIQEKEQEYRQYIDIHRANVKKAYEKIVRPYAEKYLMPQSLSILDKNIEKHDEDKDIDFIFDAYRRNHFPVDDKEKKLANKEYNIAWTYHSKINPHHWQFFLDDDNKNFTTPKLETEGEKEIYKLAYLEMLADWLSFSFKNKQNESGKGDNLSITGDSLEFEVWYNQNKLEIKIHPDMKDWLDRIIEDILTNLKENDSKIFESFNKKERKHQDNDSYVIRTLNGFIHFEPAGNYKIVNSIDKASIGYDKEEIKMTLVSLLRKFKNLKAAKLQTIADAKKDLEISDNNEEVDKDDMIEAAKKNNLQNTTIVQDLDENMKNDGIEIDGVKSTINNSGMAL